MYIEKIRSVCQGKGITIKELAKNIGMSFSGLYTTLSKDTLKVSTLVSISDYLNLPITDFFEDIKYDETRDINKLNEGLAKRNDLLEDSLSDILTVFLVQFVGITKLIGELNDITTQYGEIIGKDKSELGRNKFELVKAKIELYQATKLLYNFQVKKELKNLEAIDKDWYNELILELKEIDIDVKDIIK